MPGKPFQSSLIPYQSEIFALRSCNPPVSYARIADLLCQNYGLSIQRAAVGKFVKVMPLDLRRVLAEQKQQAVECAPAAGLLLQPAEVSRG